MYRVDRYFFLAMTVDSCKWKFLDLYLYIEKCKLLDIMQTEGKVCDDAENVSVEVEPVDNDQVPANGISSVLAALETGLIIVGLLYIYLLLPRLIASDGQWRYTMITDLLNHHMLNVANQNINLQKYSLIGPLFAVPLFVVGQMLGHPGTWTACYNLLLFSITLLTTYIILRKRIDHSLLRKFYLLLIIASMFTAHLQKFYGEVFTALCVGFGVLVALVRFSSLAGWIAVVLGVVNTPATLLGLGLMLLKKIIERKHLRYILVLLAVVALILGESWLRRGSPFIDGYANDAGSRTVMPYSGLSGFSYPFFLGLISILFSFGKGLIFFAPGLLLPIRKTLLKMQQTMKLNLYQIYTLWISFLIGMILTYARWWAWYGGRFWGPRFFLFASIPASFALAVRLRYHKDASIITNLLTLVIVCFSVWVGIDGALFNQSAIVLPICANNHYALEILCIYTPDFSALWYPFVVHLPVDSAQILFMGYCLLVFVYLVAPLMVRIAQQVQELFTKYGNAYLNISLWRF